MEHLFEDFLRETKMTKAAFTEATYRSGIVKFKQYVEGKDLLDFETFINYPVWLAGQTLSRSSKLTYFSAVEAFVDWLAVKGIIDISYANVVRFKKSKKALNGKRESKLPRTPRTGVIDTLLEQVKQNDDGSVLAKRNIAIVEFLKSTGCRIGELTKLKVKHVDDDTAIVTGKGSKERYVYLTDEAKAALWAYWNKRGYSKPNQPVFCRHDDGIGSKISGITTRTIQNLITDLCNQAGIEHITPHQFRHNFAVEVLRNTGNLALVQDLLGHADPKATRVYAKINSDELRKGHKEGLGR